MCRYGGIRGSVQSSFGRISFCAFTDDVLAIQDISVEESEDLPKILQPAAEECAATFVGNQQTVDDFSLIQLVNAISTSTLALGKLKVSFSSARFHCLSVSYPI